MGNTPQTSAYFDFTDWCLAKALWLERLALVTLATLFAVSILTREPVDWPTPCAYSQTAITAPSVPVPECSPASDGVEA